VLPATHAVECRLQVSSAHASSAEPVAILFTARGQQYLFTLRLACMRTESLALQGTCRSDTDPMQQILAWVAVESEAGHHTQEQLQTPVSILPALCSPCLATVFLSHKGCFTGLMFDGSRRRRRRDPGCKEGVRGEPVILCCLAGSQGSLQACRTRYSYSRWDLVGHGSGLV